MTWVDLAYGLGGAVAVYGIIYLASFLVGVWQDMRAHPSEGYDDE